jgi:hypothetical protein
VKVPKQVLRSDSITETLIFNICSCYELMLLLCYCYYYYYFCSFSSKSGDANEIKTTENVTENFQKNSTNYYPEGHPMNDIKQLEEI